MLGDAIVLTHCSKVIYGMQIEFGYDMSNAFGAVDAAFRTARGAVGGLGLQTEKLLMASDHEAFDF